MNDYTPQPIRIVRGASCDFELPVTDAQKQPYTLAEGEFFRFGVKRFPGNGMYLIRKDFADAGEEPGVYLFSLSPDDTSELDFGSYFYDVGLQSGEDYFPVVPCSAFEICFNVTEWEAET